MKKGGSHPQLDTSLDQRRATRVVYATAVQCRLKDDPNERWYSAQGLDFSEGGTRVFTNLAIHEKDEVEVDIFLKEEKARFRFIGEVAWFKPASMYSHYQFECGIRFTAEAHKTYVGFLADQLCSLSKKNQTGLHTRIADSLEDLKIAYGMVHQEFSKRGYCEQHPSGMYAHHYALLPESRTFVIEDRQKIIGTMSLLVDSPCGLPMESLFPEEIAALRQPGRKLAEVSMLAVDQTIFGQKRFLLSHFQKMSTSFRLFKIMFDYVRESGVTDLVIAMHPKHKDLYQYLTFQVIGPVRTYPSVRGNLALPMRMDVVKIVNFFLEKKDLLNYGRGAFFLTNPTPKEQLHKRHTWTEAPLKNLINQLDLWGKMDQAQQAAFKACHSNLPL